MQTRRAWLAGSTAVVAGTMIPPPSGNALAANVPLEVAYAGSMASAMEGPIKAAVAEKLGVEFHGHAQGSNALAQLIVGGSLAADVFISVTPSPMRIVLQAGKAEKAVPIARTAMVIAYSPKSSFADRFGAAAKPDAEPWWKVLEESHLRFGRTDPKTDPQGRNIIFVMQLAALLYKQSDLVQRVLGDVDNPSQIFEEPTVEARLQSGELDAASAYRLQPAAFSLPYVSLPSTIDLSDDRQQKNYAQASLTIGGKVYRPEPLVYYAAVLRDAPHPEKAAAFVQWLTGVDGQAILRTGFYDRPGSAAVLRA